MSEADPPSDKPAIMQESEFIVEEGILHRVFRTGAIWMNKLFFSAAFLWAVWLVFAYTQGWQDCAPGIGRQGGNASQDLDIVADGHCSVLLTVTSKYLGAMTFLSFVASIGLGMLGLVVGKRVIESTPAAEEAGARERTEGPGGAAGPASEVADSGHGADGSDVAGSEAGAGPDVAGNGPGTDGGSTTQADEEHGG